MPPVFLLPIDKLGRVNTLNVIDCTTSPTQYLHELSRVSTEWHSFCPYDWSSSVTDFAQWLGGHSRFSPWKGNPEEVIRYLFSEDSGDSGISSHKIEREIDALPWYVRTACTVDNPVSSPLHSCSTQGL